MKVPWFTLKDTTEDTLVQWQRQLNHLAENMTNAGGYLDVNMFDHGAWQQNMVANSDLLCIAPQFSKIPIPEYHDTPIPEVSAFPFGYAYNLNDGEGNVCEIEDDPISPACRRAKLHVAAGSQVEFMYTGEPVRIAVIDPREAVAAGNTRFLFSFYHAGTGVLMPSVTGNGNPFTLTVIGDDWAMFGDGGVTQIFPRRHTGSRRLTLAFDATEHGECDSITFSFVLAGVNETVFEQFLAAYYKDPETPQPEDAAEEATAYLSGFQIVADKYKGRAPVYQSGPYSLARVDGVPMELTQSVHDMTYIEGGASIPVAFGGGELVQIASFEIPGLIAADVCIPVVSRVSLSISTNAPVSIQLVLADSPTHTGSVSVFGTGFYRSFGPSLTTADMGDPTGCFVHNAAFNVRRTDGFHPVDDVTQPRTLYLFAVATGWAETSVRFDGGLYEHRYNAYRGMESLWT